MKILKIILILILAVILIDYVNLKFNFGVTGNIIASNDINLKIVNQTENQTENSNQILQNNVCEEKWKCSEWTNCSNGKRRRACSDENNCGTSENKPIETMDCKNELNHIIFSEIYYDTVGTDSKEEWIEIYNPTSQDINLSGYKLKDNSGEWKIPAIEIKSKTYIIIAKNKEGFKRLYKFYPNIEGLGVSLNNNGDMLYLVDKEGKEIDFVAWEGFVPGWNIFATTGKTIKRKSLDSDANDETDWLSDEKPSF